MLFWISVITASLYVIGSVSAYLVNVNLKNQGFTGISTAEVLNPLKWVSVFIGYFLKFVIPLHILEQYILRFYDPECRPDCMLVGRCKTCGCDSVCKAWSPMEECSKKNWPKIIWSKKEYEAFRKKFPVQIKIEYGNGIV